MSAWGSHAAKLPLSSPPPRRSPRRKQATRKPNPRTTRSNRTPSRSIRFRCRWPPNPLSTSRRKQMTDDVFFAGIAELTKKLRAKEFSCVELIRAFCDRFERLGPRYNALALSLREAAVRKAKDADADLKRERYHPLQSIPYGVKDLVAVAGSPTTWGAKPYAGQVFDEDARVVQKLDKAGAILIGKLAMVELAGGGGYRYASAS